MTARTVTQALAAIAVGVAAAGAARLASQVDGLDRAFLASASPENTIIDGAEEDPTLAQLEALREAAGPGVRLGPEYGSGFVFPRPDRELGWVDLRGLDPSALDLHRATVRYEGGPPIAGTRWALVGASQRGRYEGMIPGADLWLGEHPYRVIGVVEAPGTLFESEVWCDREMLMKDFGAAGLTKITVRGASEGLSQKVRALGLRLRPERANFEARNADHARDARTAAALAGVLALAALLPLARAARTLRGERPAQAIGRLAALVALPTALGVLIALVPSRTLFYVDGSVTYPAYLGRGSLVLLAVLAVAAVLVGTGVWAAARRARPLPRFAGWLALVGGFAVVGFAATVAAAIAIDVAHAHDSVDGVHCVAVTPRSYPIGMLPARAIELVREQLGPAFKPAWFRVFGGKVGERAEPFQIMAISPDFLDAGGSEGTHLDPPLDAAWRAMPDGAVVVGGLSERRGWQDGQALRIRTPIGELPVRIVGRAGGVAPDKLLVHFAHLGSVLPSERQEVSMIVVPIGGANANELQRAISEKLGRAGLPVLVPTSGAILRWELGLSALLHQTRSVAGSLVLALALFVLALSRTLRRAPRWLAMSGLGAAVGALAAWLRFRTDALDAGAWVLSNVRVDGSKVAAGLAVAILLASAAWACDRAIPRTRAVEEPT